MSEGEFRPLEPLVKGVAEGGCRAVVIVPARNEEVSLAGALDALSDQIHLAGNAVACDCYEILLLLNNCTDGSARVAAEWKARHPEVRLHVTERTFPKRQAFVGTARRMLMDTAWCRLRASRGLTCILSTDADTLVARDWIARNLAALEAGADAVGGAIELKAGELEAMPEGARRGYVRDKRYQRLVAELEHLLDPHDYDPWPRHLEHFGASLGCTPEIYGKAGGLPAVNRLEDVAFVGELRRVGARLRHDPAVKVYTSARVHGRVEVGMSGQLKIWQEMSERGDEHRVPSGSWHSHRFQTLRELRKVWAGEAEVTRYPNNWRRRLGKALKQGFSETDFLREIRCEELVEEMFRGNGVGDVRWVNRGLAVRVKKMRNRVVPPTITAIGRSDHRVPGIWLKPVT